MLLNWNNGCAQQIAFQQHDTPIIVVVITRMASFGYQGDEIGPFLPLIGLTNGILAHSE